MVLSQRSELSVELDSDKVFLHGTVNESAGVTLRGTVILCVTKVTKIKAIVLRFQGKNKVCWSEGVGSAQRHYAEQFNIIDHTYNIIEPKENPYFFTAGTFKWDFELPLPGNLPSTLHHELGEVSYQLKAIAKRPVLSFNYSAIRDTIVARLTLASSLELNQSVVVSSEWPDKIAYNISLPRLIFSPGSPVHIVFDMRPLTTGLSIQAIWCFLEECVTLSCNNHTFSEDHLVKVVSDTKSFSFRNKWSHTKVFVIPEHYNGRPIQMDAKSDLITISHKFKVIVSLKNSDGHTSEMRVIIPVVVASVVPEEEANELPVYEDAWKSLRYDPITMANSVGSNRLSMDNIYETSRIVNDPLSELLPWEGTDLMQVPSYTTAI